MELFKGSRKRFGGWDSESLLVGRSRDRIPVGRKFSVPFRPARKPTHPRVQGLQGFLGLMQPQHGADYPPPSSTGLRRVGTVPPTLLCACINMPLVIIGLYGLVFTASIGRRYVTSEQQP